MDNPILVEVRRGTTVESRHRGSVVVSDAAGAAVLSVGDIEAPVFPRSAVKVFQAIALVESGAADRFGFGDRELALACASHSGEPGHVGLVADMLGRAGLHADDLECGCHWPFQQGVTLALARSGMTPGALHNNCSGKHSGFLCTAVHLGEPTKDYVREAHPVQARARAVIEDLTRTRLGVGHGGVDGCSIPTYAAPLKGFAAGFARLAAGTGAAPERIAAGRRLMAACMAEPWYMAGTDRACVRLMAAAPGRVFAKTGAEGVFCGAVPELGLGFALKIDDGATRASEAAVAATLAWIFREHDTALADVFAAQGRRTLRNWRKTEVGDIRAIAL